AFLGRARLAIFAATAAVLGGSALALDPAVRVLLGAPALVFERPWSVPGGTLSLGIDRLAAFFILTILGLTCAAAVYGAGYLGRYAGKKPLGAVLLFFNLLPIALCLVVTAQNAVLFLVGWELMAVFAFLLVSFEHEREDVR